MFCTVYQLFNKKKMRNDSYLQQGQEGLFLPFHSYIWQPADTLNENSKSKSVQFNKERESTWTLLINSWVTTLNEPEMIRNLLYLHVLQKVFSLLFTTHEECGLCTPAKIPYYSYSWNFSHLDNGFTFNLLTRSVYSYD